MTPQVGLVPVEDDEARFLLKNSLARFELAREIRAFR